MAQIREDRVVETSVSTGTGVFTVAGAVTGYRSFSSVCTVGDTFYGVIEGVDVNGVPTGEWEDGLYTYSAANQITRTTVQRSSNANAAVTFSAGTKRVSLQMTSAAISVIAASGGAANPAHRYWRVRVTTFTDSFPGISAVTMLIAGTNVATGGTAFASSQYDGTHLPSYAFDGVPSTDWTPNVSTPGSWVAYDFGVGVTKAITGISLASRTDGYGKPLIGAFDWSDDNATWYYAGAFDITGVAAGTPTTFAVSGAVSPTIKAQNLATYSAASINVPFPAGAVAGDIALVHAQNGYTVPTVTQAGWQQLKLSDGNYTNGITIIKVLTAGDITTGFVTITWAGSFDGVYSCVLLYPGTVNGLRDVVGFGTAGSTSFATLAMLNSLLIAATDLVVVFACTRGNAVVAVTNFTALQTAVQTTNASGFVGKYTGTLGKFGFAETISASAGNNGIEYCFVAFR